MNKLETAITATLRAQAQGAAMSTDTPQEQEILQSRLDTIDKQARTRRVIWGTVAAVAAAVLVVAGARAFFGSSNQDGNVVAPRKALFSSTEFGVPFTVDSLPSWLTTQTLTPTSESAEWVTWNRCPRDVDNECIGLSFNRYTSVNRDARTAVGFLQYIAYFEGLGSSGKVTIQSRKDTQVDGLPAVVYDITTKTELSGGVGCHQLVFDECDDFFVDVPGRYAVVDTGRLDPSGAVFVVWTRAGGVGPAEAGWQEQFDQMLTTLKFSGAASPSPTG
jgi:hypothetical protein